MFPWRLCFVSWRFYRKKIDSSTLSSLLELTFQKFGVSLRLFVLVQFCLGNTGCKLVINFYFGLLVSCSTVAYICIYLCIYIIWK